MLDPKSCGFLEIGKEKFLCNINQCTYSGQFSFSLPGCCLFQLLNCFFRFYTEFHNTSSLCPWVWTQKTEIFSYNNNDFNLIFLQFLKYLTHSFLPHSDSYLFLFRMLFSYEFRFEIQLPTIRTLF